MPGDAATPPGGMTGVAEDAATVPGGKAGVAEGAFTLPAGTPGMPVAVGATVADAELFEPAPTAGTGMGTGTPVGLWALGPECDAATVEVPEPSPLLATWAIALCGPFGLVGALPGTVITTTLGVDSGGEAEAAALLGAGAAVARAFAAATAARVCHPSRSASRFSASRVTWASL